MNKNPRIRVRNENLLKSRLPSDGERAFRMKSQIRIAKELEKAVRNRCCYVRPKQIDFSQLTERSVDGYTDAYMNIPSMEQHSTLNANQNGFNSAIPVETNSETTKFLANSASTALQNVNSIQDIEKFLQEITTEDAKKQSLCSSPKNIRISETPKVKTIAEKFSKFKRKNTEIRRLDEKLVCVEYDVFNQETIEDTSKPMQRMRAFFSIKPSHEDVEQAFPLQIKQEFHVSDKDLINLTEKEIEIIDDKIEENKSYLEELRSILKRNQSIEAKKKKSCLDLKSLYEMAKQTSYFLNSDSSVVNFLSQAELKEIKSLILNQCKSSVHGISRRKIKSEDSTNFGMGAVSGSIVAEILRENGKIDVFK